MGSAIWQQMFKVLWMNMGMLGLVALALVFTAGEFVILHMKITKLLTKRCRVCGNREESDGKS